MPALTATIITGLAAAAGVATSIYGQQKQADARKKGDAAYALQAQENAKITAASLRAEKAREMQMRLDAQRARRNTIREGQVARSLAASRQVGAGNSAREGQQSSGFEGAKSQIAGGVGYGLGGINAGEQFGGAIFRSNYDILGYQRNLATIGSSLNSIGRDVAEANNIFNLGKEITASAPAAGREGASLFDNTEPNNGFVTTVERA